VPHLLFLIENKKQQIPLPPRRSKLWSAVRMRDRDDTIGLMHSVLLSALAEKTPAHYTGAGWPLLVARSLPKRRSYGFDFPTRR
jgi:hypothetical protein